MYTEIAISKQEQEQADFFANNSQLIELQEYLTYNNNNQVIHVQVELSAAGVHFRCGNDEELLLRYTDIVGTQCLPQKQGNQNDDISVCLHIYAYVKQQQPLRRVRNTRILNFCKSDNHANNLSAAKFWQQAIAHNKRLKQAGDELTLKQQWRPLLIFLNPKSGAGKARAMFHNKMTPLLQEANVKYELLVTTSANYARDQLRTRQDLLQQYGGVVVVSGDGLFCEILNGLMERDDWQLVARQLPLGIVPCGSGNGLARSIAHLYDEPYENNPVQNGLFNCVSGQSAPLDIVRLEVGPEIMYSFLSVGWGMIADIDIESEYLRFIGTHRFTIWTLYRLLNLRTYWGRLSYLPSKVGHEARQTCEQFYDALDVGGTGDNADDAFVDAATPSRKIVGSLPPLDTPLNYGDNSWQSEEGEFVMVHAAYTSHLGADAFFVPEAQLNDGKIYLVIIRAGISRVKLLQFFLGLSTGTHLPQPPSEFISFIPVTAFRLEPFSKKGIIAVDGELVAYGPIQGEILPGVVNVMVPPSEK